MQDRQVLGKEKSIKHCSDVCAIVITFNPNLHTLHRLLSTLSLQVHKIIVVDNGSTNEMQTWDPRIQYSNVYLHRVGKNLGIGAAQNIGINSVLKDKEIKFILLSDQDSDPADDMVYELRDTAYRLLNSGKKVAAVGPRYLDVRRNNPPPFIRIEGLRVKRQQAPLTGSVVAVDYLIASGCLIPVTTLKTVGLMNEEMFIDYVDIEWGLRAKKKGFQSFGDFKAEMSHSLGEEPISFLGSSFPVHSPLRHYYMTRNAVWLYKQSDISREWKFVDGYRLLLRIGFYILHAKPRLEHAAMMFKGIYHGIISRMGKL